MHKLLLNVLELTLGIQPNGPILIKSGTEDGIDPTLPNMNFVRSMNPKLNRSTIYLPGSSLKGVIRSHGERIVRTIMGDANACDPLQDGCDLKFDTNRIRRDNVKGNTIYREICPVCKTFGDNVMASRFLVSDAYPISDNTLATRQMVAIDRRSGGSINTFTMEVATQGEFQVKILLRNFERWQVGLVALVLRDIGLGRIGIGFGKSRGLGQVTLDYQSLNIEYSARPKDIALDRHIFGVGDLLAHAKDKAHQQMIEQYGFVADPALAESPAQFQTSDNLQAGDDTWGRYLVQASGNDAVTTLLKASVPSWKQYTEM